ncbi:hypothetical protein L6164_018789 [Bauhinia variegata]|uniref:Uncharacterized protein n=1 Tax=Bauhinia variegata TaxID=167791 RepID=A0ACB9NDP6_BAUVA|nr:hypothetical protein L6164_018789 [Bauhinia variegata]
MQSVFHLVRYHWRRAQWPCYSASMRAVAYLCLCASLLCFSDRCLARDTLNAVEKIFNNGTSLVSAQGMFELGFFSPQGNTTNRYLGIWYHGLQPQTVVWVANRDEPITDGTGVVLIRSDGNLVVSNRTELYWWTKLGISSPTHRKLKLMDSGNLVFMDDQSGEILWQSFDEPTDTFLPGMRMRSRLVLTSWTTAGNPASGDFTFKLRKVGDYRYMITTKQSHVHWQGGRVAEFGSEEMRAETIYLLTNSTLNNSPYKYFGGNFTKFSGSLNFTYTRLLMNSTGNIQLLRWDNSGKEWNIQWNEPSNKCKIPNICGYFKSCNSNNRPSCKCLPGFNQTRKKGHSGDSAEPEGCVRKSTLSCEGNDITFLNLRKVKVGIPGQPITAKTEEECRSHCWNLCHQCQAYSYNASRWSDGNNSLCLIWNQDLPTLQEGNFVDGLDLSILVKTSDIASTTRTCQPCSTNIIPYPLSTGQNCGDPMYFRLNCSEETGQLNFMMGGRTYPVTGIDSDEKKLSIKIEGSGYCDEGFQKDEPSLLPFSVTDECIGEDEIDISWRPPQEPPCNNSIDCKGWPHSTCHATTEGTQRCLCDTNYKWDDSNFTCTQETTSGEEQLSLILVITLASTLVVACILFLAYIWRRKMAPRQDSRSAERIRGHIYNSETRVTDMMDWRGLDENDTEGMGVPYFDFESIQEATDNFSDANKLGRGGYGPVYKGKFRGGQGMAVKRLSSVSSQGFEEFKNERKKEHGILRVSTNIKPFGLCMETMDREQDTGSNGSISAGNL